MIGAVPGVKAEYVVMVFDIFSFLILSVVEIGPYTGNGKVLAVTVKCANAVVLAGDKPRVFERVNFLLIRC